MGYYGKFSTIPIGDIKPKGWLKEFLITQKNGLTGHLDEAGHPFDQPFWERESFKNEDDWTPYEQNAYHLDGKYKVGILLDDISLMKQVNEIFEYVLSHPDEDGYLGPSFLKYVKAEGYVGLNRWPHVVLFRALLNKYEIEQKEETLNKLIKHYKMNTDYSNDRDVCNVEIMVKLYEITEDEYFLELAEKSYVMFNEKFSHLSYSMGGMNTNKKPHAHGVSFCEIGKLGAVLYLYTGKKEYLTSCKKGFKRMMRYNLLVDGAPCSCEHLYGNRSSLCSHETCDVVDFAWAMHYLLMATGDGKYADYIEDVVFNAGIGSVTDEFSGLQYFSCPNQVIADRTSNHNLFFRGDKWMSYRPNPGTACCPGNVNRMMPNFASMLWMKKDDTVFATMYSPSKIKFKIKNQEVTIEEKTSYPFENEILLKVSIVKKVNFSIGLKIPLWCENYTIYVNEEEYKEVKAIRGFVKIRKEFADGDTIRIVLDASIRTVECASRGISVKYGALLYALPIETRIGIDTEEKNCSKDFPAYNYYPESEWNYGIVIDDIGAAKLELGIQGLTPWKGYQNNIVIYVPAKKIDSWKINRKNVVRYILGDGQPQKTKKGEFNLTPELPLQEDIFLSTDNEIGMIQLVSYCTTKLRVAIFPKIRRW